MCPCTPTARLPRPAGIACTPPMASLQKGMTNTIHAPPPSATDWHDSAFDLMRGIAAYSGSALMKGLADVLGKHPEADLGNAFNHKQVGSKMWARDALYDTLGGKLGNVVLLGGWYGILPAMMFDDVRFDVERVTSYDIDPAVGVIAETLNKAWADRFAAVTADMYALDYAALRSDLVINTSCEHIADLRAWLALLPKGSRVMLQSNDYFSEPTHINCVPTLEAFIEQAQLSILDFSGSLKMKKYTRFMLIGRV
jgi:hypothetical protein